MEFNVSTYLRLFTVVDEASAIPIGQQVGYTPEQTELLTRFGDDGRPFICSILITDQQTYYLDFSYRMYQFDPIHYDETTDYARCHLKGLLRLRPFISFLSVLDPTKLYVWNSHSLK